MPRKSTPPPSINITPLVDVLLVIMCLLMLLVAPTLHKLPISLPSTNTPSLTTLTPSFNSSITLSLAPNGVISLDNQQITLDEIASKITPNHTIHIAADKDVPYSLLATSLAKLSALKPHAIELLVKN